MGYGGWAKKKEKTLLRRLEHAARKSDREGYLEWRFVALAAGLKADVERCDAIFGERVLYGTSIRYREKAD